MKLNVRDYPLRAREPFRIILDFLKKVLELTEEKLANFSEALNASSTPVILLRPEGQKLKFTHFLHIDLSVTGLTLNPVATLIKILKSFEIESLIGKSL